MNNFTKRTLTGAGFVIVMLGSAFLGQMVFSILFLLVFYLATLEFLGLIEKGGYSPARMPAILVGLLLYGSLALNAMDFLPSKWLLMNIPLLFLVFIVELWRNKPNPFVNIGLGLVSVLYIALPLGLTIFLFNPAYHSGVPHYGKLIGYLLILWMNDTGAYLVGSKFGKHRLFERISPKKSWEGTVGGVILAAATAYGLSFLFPVLSAMTWVMLGVMIGVIGNLADLVESLLKRSLGVKDSGAILPGHGGILDRFDAVLISIPFVFVFLTLFS